MAQLNVYLTFKGNCAEAMDFYRNCLEAELTLQTVGGSPAAAQFPENMQNQVMHSVLTKGSVLMMASDMLNSGEFVPGNNFSLSLNCESEEEINNFFPKLSVGGKVLEPLKVQFWGGTFGMLIDKFGIRWMLNYQPKQVQ